MTAQNGQITLISKRFAHRWKRPSGLRTETDETRLPAFMRARTLGEQAPLQVGSHALPQAATGSGEHTTLALRGGRYFERHATTLQTHGKPSGQLIGFRDVPERQRADQSLAEWNASLESRIRVRTRELDQARQPAEAASQAKERLPVEHEPRDPHLDERCSGHGLPGAAGQPGPAPA